MVAILSTVTHVNKSKCSESTKTEIKKECIQKHNTFNTDKFGQMKKCNTNKYIQN